MEISNKDRGMILAAAFCAAGIVWVLGSGVEAAGQALQKVHPIASMAILGVGEIVKSLGTLVTIPAYYIWRKDKYIRESSQNSR